MNQHLNKARGFHETPSLSSVTQFWHDIIAKKTEITTMAMQYGKPHALLCQLMLSLCVNRYPMAINQSS